jgi:hypothetical protein
LHRLLSRPVTRQRITLKVLAAVINQDLRSVLGDHPTDIDVDNLSTLKTPIPIVSFGQFTPVDSYL